MEAQGAHTHPKNTQVPPRGLISLACVIRCNAFFTPGGTSLYRLYRYVRRQRVRYVFFSRFGLNTLGTRGFSRVRREVSVLAEGRHVFGPKLETALEESLAPRVWSEILGYQFRPFWSEIGYGLCMRTLVLNWVCYF